MPIFLSATTLHIPDLISDLGLILVTAAIAVLIFRLLKQPLVLGYLVAGFLAGSEFDFFPTVKDMNSVKVWAEFGVIFLLFSLLNATRFFKVRTIITYHSISIFSIT